MSTTPAPEHLAGEAIGRARRALPLRAEARRQLRRPRTLWAGAILFALPLIVVAAFALGDGGDPGGALFSDLATSGAANFAVFMLLVAAELLILILAALFVGDSVPAEASWGSLRYLLTAPVPRARLLTSKLIIGLLTSAVALVAFVSWSLVVGGLAYGWAALTIPLAGTLDWPTVLGHLALASGYVFVSVLPFAALAFWVGVAVDTPLGAVGAAVLAAIVSSILDALDALGDWRRALPNHYSRGWIELFQVEPDLSEMLHGVAWCALYTTVFLALAYRHFARKDVLS
ncbi:ABC transporter permease [Nostocoides vanveenii]|uniref:ABC transporter permease n=1 Tax=Nostocoides vanveenii TaxID=330835 RepID=A0ABN2K8F3_9MICO